MLDQYLYRSSIKNKDILLIQWYITVSYRTYCNDEQKLINNSFHVNAVLHNKLITFVQLSQISSQISNLLVCFNSSTNFVIYSIFGKKFRAKLKEAFTCRNNSINSMHTNQLTNLTLLSINQNNPTHLSNNSTSNYSNGTSNKLSLVTPIDFSSPKSLGKKLSDETNQFSTRKSKNDLHHLPNETFV